MSLKSLGFSFPETLSPNAVKLRVQRAPKLYVRRVGTGQRQVPA
jgi:hypothetical protein